MKISSWMLWRIGLSWLVAVVVALAALSSLSTVHAIGQIKQDRTRKKFTQIAQAIAEHRRGQGSLPQNLNDLPVSSIDSWSRQIRYVRRGGSYYLLSLGEDGKPGGVGASCDLSSDNPNPREATLAWWQMAAQPSAGPVLVGAAVCAALTFAFVFSSIKIPQSAPTSSQIAAVAVKLLAMAMFAGFIAMTVGMLDVPSGH